MKHTLQYNAAATAAVQWASVSRCASAAFYIVVWA